jgi:hypothetical protein
MTSPSLPNIRILATKSLVTHEDADPRRFTRLADRISQDGFLKHPPVVAAIPDSDQYVVLDGANRVTALKTLKVPHLVVQIVSYSAPGIRLDTWYHVVAGMPLEKFENELAQIPEMTLRKCTLEDAREALSTNNATAYIITEEGIRMVRNQNGASRDLGLLSKLVAIYKGKAEIYRRSNDLWEEQAQYHPDITALVVFPKITPADVINAARHGKRIPTGITRHIISPRALNLNIPFELLNRADWSLERKQAWLEDWLMERVAAHGVRLYTESTFSFDE